MNEITKVENDFLDLSIIEEQIRKSYLSSISQMEVASVEMPDLENDIIDNIRLYRVTEMVYKKGEPATDKFTTVFNALVTYSATAFIIIDSDGKKTDFYVGIRNNEGDESVKKSTVTLGDTLKNTLIGQFPGIKIEDENREKIAAISRDISNSATIASVSVLGTEKKQDRNDEEQFVQGLEKLGIALEGRKYTGLIIAQNKSSSEIRNLRRVYQNLYTELSPLQKVQITDTISDSRSHKQKVSELSPKERRAYIANKVLEASGMIGGAMIGSVSGSAAGVLAGIAGGYPGMIIGGVIGGIGGAAAGAAGGKQFVAPAMQTIEDFIPRQQITHTESTATSTTTENKQITDLLKLIDENLRRLDECESYGMWNIAAYFASDDISTAEIAANNYRSLMSGENSGREVSAVNSWRKMDKSRDDVGFITDYLSRFVHPLFCIGSNEQCDILVDATTAVSGKELGLHLGLPRSTVTGMPVIERAEFGKEVVVHDLIHNYIPRRPEDYITLGNVFDLGIVTEKMVELKNDSLNMHTFITGSTGSGKSNTVYQILNELHQDKVNFLVIEPAKGEYKDCFGNWDDVNVYSTNPNVAEMVSLNPFMFPDSIHVLEHVDGLVEIFSMCWPLYDAMPAFLKDAILRSYESVGWDLGSSVFEGEEKQFPSFDTLLEQLNQLIEASDYASDVKSNYRGALITRVKSLTIGLNRYLFSSNATPYEKIFDENCILDISRIKSNETQAFIMGLMVYMLNEYRVDKKKGSNKGLKHVTVLEEAHKLLKNNDNNTSELVGKSVELLTQTIAEIRTYGEGFIIVDQSPSSVDIAAIKNTNTKIVLRTPEANDRETVGRSIGLNENQVNEIAKLPSGVAVVYQNNWVTPVLTKINKAEVEEIPYVKKSKTVIISKREARSKILRMVMQPWLGNGVYQEMELRESLAALDVNTKYRKKIEFLIDTYLASDGELSWKEEELILLQQIIQNILEMTDNEFIGMDHTELIALVKSKVLDFTDEEINEVCYYVTYVMEV